MTGAKPRAKDRKNWLVVLAVLVSVTIGGAIWSLTSSHDPFAELDAQEETHTAHNSLLDETNRTTYGLSPSEQLRQIDLQLQTSSNNPALLAAKIHLGLEYAPSVAAQECRRILEQSPNNYFALHHAAMAYLAMTNLDRAMHYAAQALQVRDTPEAHFVAGHIFYAKGNFPSALQHYRTVLEKNPQEETARGFVEKAERAMAPRR